MMKHVLLAAFGFVAFAGPVAAAPIVPAVALMAPVETPKAWVSMPSPTVRPHRVTRSCWCRKSIVR